VNADSDAPVGTVKLCASFESTGGTVKKIIEYDAVKGFYRRVFKNVAAQPPSVTVTSDAGGTDSELVPFP
jgi:hypothetical protein